MTAAVPNTNVPETALKASGTCDSSWKRKGPEAVCTQTERSKYTSVVCVDDASLRDSLQGPDGAGSALSFDLKDQLGKKEKVHPSEIPVEGQTVPKWKCGGGGRGRTRRSLQHTPLIL